MLHCQRPFPQTTASAHEFLDSTLKRTEAKSNKLSVTKSAETISQQDSAIESLASENDFHQWLRDTDLSRYEGEDSVLLILKKMKVELSD